MGMDSVKIKELMQSIGATAKAKGVYVSKAIATHPKETLEITKAGAGLYSVYAKHQASRSRTKKVKSETKRKMAEAEKRRKSKRLLRRPSRERGIL